MPDVAPRPEAVVDLASRWARTVADTSYVQMDLAETETYLIALAEQVMKVWSTEPFDAESARRVGSALVDGHFTNPDTLRRTLAMLPEVLAGDVLDPETLTRIGTLLGMVAAGYATRLQERTLTEQDAIRTATVVARSEAETAARASEARFRAVFAGAAIGMGLGDTDGNIIDANPALMQMLGYSLREMQKRNVADFMHPDDAQQVWKLYEQLILGRRESFQTAKQFKRSDGSAIWTHLTVSLIRTSAGEPEFQVAVIEDVTDLRRLQIQLQHQADHDELTGLANRGLFQRRLSKLTTDPVEGGRLGLCLIDLDGFKAINDSVGHAVGDQVLVEVASRLDAAVEKEGHLVARLGGDEFVILVQDTIGPADVIAVAEAAFRAVEQPITIAGRAYSITASAGLVERATTSADTADLMRAADITLYWAKADGKDRWALFDHERSAREVAQYTLARMLPEALQDNQLHLVYQPLVTLATGVVTGVEALLRWNHPKLGNLLPGRFIDAAEESGIIVPLGAWILQTACRQGRTWAGRGADSLRISVNIAIRQLADPQLIPMITAMLRENDLPPGQLQLELTERAVIGSDSEPLAVLRALADIGVRIAIDDFGTGYSNMTYLRRLPVCELKLAGSFINAVHASAESHPVDSQIVGSLVSLAHTLGMTVTAEEVETFAQAEALRELGCDTAQGNYFGAPSSPEDIQRLIDEHQLDPEARPVGC